MSQPTREEFERLEVKHNQLEAEHNQLREEVRRLKEQRTDEMKAIRVDVASADVEQRLDNHTEMLREISQKQDKFSTDIDEPKLDAKAYIGDAAIFKNKVERMEIDVSTLKTDMEQVKIDIGTVKTVQNGHSKFFEEHGKRLGQIEASMATKEDLKTMATKDDITRLEDLIKQLLPPKPGEGQP